MLGRRAKSRNCLSTQSEASDRGCRSRDVHETGRDVQCPQAFLRPGVEFAVAEQCCARGAFGSLARWKREIEVKVPSMIRNQDSSNWQVQ